MKLSFHFLFLASLVGPTVVYALPDGKASSSLSLLATKVFEVEAPFTVSLWSSPSEIPSWRVSVRTCKKGGTCKDSLCHCLEPVRACGCNNDGHACTSTY